MAGKPVPHDEFSPFCYRQPSLKEGAVYPEPYRVNDETYDLLLRQSSSAPRVGGMGAAHRRPSGDESEPLRPRRGSVTIDHDLLDEGDDDKQTILEAYYRDYVLPLAQAGEAVYLGPRPGGASTPETGEQDDMEALGNIMMRGRHSPQPLPL